MRKAVEVFAEAMEERLHKYDGRKDGWGSRIVNCDYLLTRLVHNLSLYIQGADPANCLLDIANFAMMLWHRIKKTGHVR